MLPSVLLIKHLAIYNVQVSGGKAPVVPDSSHPDRFITAARGVCTYVSVHLVVRQ